MEAVIPKRDETKKNIGSTNKDIFYYIKKDMHLYILLLPVIIFYIVFHYFPMYGIVMAFQDYNIFRGVFGSQWVGFSVFNDIFNTKDFWIALRNTLVLNVVSLIVGFPGPIILALLYNELKMDKLKRVLQSTVYLPHFISWVVVAGMIMMVFSYDHGVVNEVLKIFGIAPIPFMTDSKWWVVVYVFSGIWKDIGWGTIVYLAALTSIDTQLYEASIVDGANKWRQLWHITLPGIKPTIVLFLILNMGQMFSIGLDKPFMLSNSMVLNVSNVLSTYVYNVGISNGRYSFSTAVGLFQSVVNFILLASVNRISNKITGDGLWEVKGK